MPASKVRFFYEQKFSFPDRSQTKKAIQRIFIKEGRELQSLNYIFCTDKRLLEINRQFLKHDYFTDIITFDLSTTDRTEAEVYISVDRVRENAKDLDSTFKAEILRVIFHGALHLCGYNDKATSAAKKMRKREDYYLNLFLGKGST